MGRLFYDEKPRMQYGPFKVGDRVRVRVNSPTVRQFPHLAKWVGQGLVITKNDLVKDPDQPYNTNAKGDKYLWCFTRDIPNGGVSEAWFTAKDLEPVNG